MGPGWYEEQKERLGLNDPLPVRYVLWLKEVAQGNLLSYADRQPIADKITERIWPTVKLMLTVQLLALAIALPIGVVSALRQYSWIDYLTTIFGFATIAVPSFFLALAAIYVFTVDQVAADLRDVDDRRAALAARFDPSPDPAGHRPGAGQAAPLIRYTRSSMLETIRQDYVRTARAKGLAERAVVYGHACATP